MNLAADLRPTGKISGVLTRSHKRRVRAPWYWVLTQSRDFIRSYIWGRIQTSVAILASRVFHVVTITSELQGELYDHKTGVTTVFGVTSRRVVTDAFVALLIDACDTGASPALDLFNFGAFGSGSTGEAAGDIALVTEFTTQYATDNVRPTGTISQPAANQYRMAVTFAPDASVTLNEFCPMTQAAVGGGSAMDRSLTGAQTMESGDSYTVTYTLTITSGG